MLVRELGEDRLSAARGDVVIDRDHLEIAFASVEELHLIAAVGVNLLRDEEVVADEAGELGQRCHRGEEPAVADTSLLNVFRTDIREEYSLAVK